MAEAARKIQQPVPDHDAIIREVADKPIVLLTDPVKLDAYLAALRAEVEANPGDVATAKGRDIIKSNAAEIGRKKTAVEKERLRATEEWRTLTNTVNAAGKVVKERMQALQDEVRAPLTTWEEREDARQNEAKSIIEDMRSAAIIQHGDTSADIRERMERVRGRNLSDEMFGPRIEEVTDLRDATVAALQAALERIEQEERDRAELQRLREEREQRARDDAARAEREAQEAAEKAASERAEQERIEREKAVAAAEEQRKADDAARIERERQEAVEQAQREAETRAEQERLEAAAAAQAEIDAANERAAAAEREAQAERARIAAAEQVRKDDETRAAAAQAQREADLEHRSNVMRAAKEALMETASLSEAKAKSVVLQIAAGNIPRVSISF